MKVEQGVTTDSCLSSLKEVRTQFRTAIDIVLAATVYREVLGYDTIIYIGSFNLTVIDPAFVFVFYSALTCLYRARYRFNLIRAVVLFIFLLFVLNLMRGILGDPLKALTSLRANGVFIGLLVLGAFSTLNLASYASLKRQLIFFGSLLSLVVVLRVIFGSGFLRLVEGESEGRPVSAQGAFLIAAASVCLLHHLLQTKRVSARKYGWCLLLVISLMVTRQATATIAGVTSLLSIISIQKGRLANTRFVFTVFFVTFSVIFYLCTLIWPNFLAEILSYMPEFIQETMSNRSGTFETRQLVWQGVIASHSNLSLFSKFVGVPAGYIPEVFIDHPMWGFIIWENSYHSMYYGLLVSSGYLGLSLYISLIFCILLKCLPFVFNNSEVTIPLSLTLLSSIFSYSYDLRLEGGVTMAISIASGLALRRNKPMDVPRGRR